MPKFMVYASEEVFYAKEVEADNEQHAIEVFNETMDVKDIAESQNLTIEQVEEIENAY